MAYRASRLPSASFETPVFDQALLDTLPIAAYVCDSDGRLTYYNRRAAALWGRSPERSCAAVKFPRAGGVCGAEVERAMAAVLRSGEPADGIETIITRPDGTQLGCRVNIAPLGHAGGELIGAIAVIEDAAAREPAAEDLRRESPTARRSLEENEKRFRELLDALPAAIYTTDATGRVTFYNEAAVEAVGRRPMLGSDQWCVSWRLFRPDGTPMRHDECPMAIALREDRPIRGVELIAERPDGTRLTLMPFPTPLHDASGAVVGAVNMLMDISDRKRAEQTAQLLNETLERRVEEARHEIAAAFSRLQESEHRFRLLVEGVSDYAIYMLDPEGIVTNWNSGAERIKGYSADEIVGQHFSRFYRPEERADGVPQRALDTARRVGKYEAEGWRMRKDGNAFWASVVVDAIHDETGALMGFAKVTRDLTEKRAAEERLRHSQKLEAVGLLTGGVAHDFNNLLTAIIGNLELLATTLPAQERVQRYADAALRAASRGARLTEHLLAFSRRQELRPEIASINHLLQDMLILCQRTVGDSIELVLDLADDLWTCCIDATQFSATVFNLLGNARDAMGGVGQITIASENVATIATDAIDLEPGDYVMLSVTDTGCGMDAAVLSRAFEPFYTTKDVGKGTGLGLSQVYGFAKQSGGAARIESKAGFGTTVRVYLPRMTGKSAGDASAEHRDRRAPVGNATILVVDDDDDVREMTVAMLSELGYRILAARTGPEALALLQCDRSIDLLFSDVVMPAGMSGVELARAARRHRPDLRVLISSGHVRDTQAQPIHPEFPFIAKPYRRSTLGPRIAALLAEGG